MCLYIDVSYHRSRPVCANENQRLFFQVKFYTRSNAKRICFNTVVAFGMFSCVPFRSVLFQFIYHRNDESCILCIPRSRPVKMQIMLPSFRAKMLKLAKRPEMSLQGKLYAVLAMNSSTWTLTVLTCQMRTRTEFGGLKIDFSHPGTRIRSPWENEQ